MTPQHESENWAVSPYNFDDTVRAGMTLPPHVTICDLTLREGRQFEGVNLRKEDVILVAQELAAAGVPPVRSSTRKRDDRIKRQMLKKCCSARISVGAMKAT